MSLINNKPSAGEEYNFKSKIIWPNLIVQILIHVGFCIGLYNLLTFKLKCLTYIWFFVLIFSSGVGITAGVHRLWSHKSYKAKFPLRLILIILFTISGQKDAYTWCLDHRIHHKYTETDSDPHNAKRGFFFAHIGWLFLSPHPLVVEKRKNTDLSDLKNDAVVMWQKRYYVPLFLLLNVAIPTMIPNYFWQENVWISFWTCFVCRFCITLNIAFSVNSVAHMYGSKPYDKNVMSVDNNYCGLSILALGELNHHNFHHTFPFDCRASEFGGNKRNVTTAFIDFFSWIGWVSDRKYATNDMIARKVLKSGDGSHHMISDDLTHKSSL